MSALRLKMPQKMAKMRPESAPSAHSSMKRPCAVHSSAAPTPRTPPPTTTTARHHGAW